MSISNATKNEIYRFSRCNMPSESDADASRCIDAAEDAAARCDFAKAERLLLKAVRLCPLVDVQNLLREVRAKMKESEASGPSNGRRAAVYAQSLPNDSGDADAADTCLQKAQAALKTGKLEAAERWAARALRLRSQQDVVADLLLRVEEAKRLRALQPSPAQLDAITRVMAATNDYERLGVDSQASQAAIKKAYRKLHLLVHPDKNRAPGATEAFRVVNAAYERLTK